WSRRSQAMTRTSCPASVRSRASISTRGSGARWLSTNAEILTPPPDPPALVPRAGASGLGIDRHVRGQRVEHLVGGPVPDHLAMVEPDDAGARAPDLGEVVAHQDDRSGVVADLADPGRAASLELLVPDCERLVDEEDLR